MVITLIDSSLKFPMFNLKLNNVTASFKWNEKNAVNNMILNDGS